MPSPPGPHAAFDAAMARFAPALPLAVAFSGGADSTALLTACTQRWPAQVRAVHVHHGLQPAADDFVDCCRATCEALQVPLSVCRTDARHALGESPEAAARAARYASFRAFSQGLPAQDAIKTIAIAQHADDQVETVLLALSRGAGLAGLAAMPQRWLRDAIAYERPLLQVPGAAIRQWLAAQPGALRWIEDPSNGDPRFTRNRIRHALLPALAESFPQFRETFARSARHAAQAQAVLDEVAAADLHACGIPPAIASLQRLSAGRQALALRYWLRSVHDTTPEAAQIDELLRQLHACTTRGHRIDIKVGAGHVRREGEVLGWYNPAAEPDAAAVSSPPNIGSPAARS